MPRTYLKSSGPVSSLGSSSRVLPKTKSTGGKENKSGKKGKTGKNDRKAGAKKALEEAGHAAAATAAAAWYSHRGTGIFSDDEEDGKGTKQDTNIRLKVKTRRPALLPLDDDDATNSSKEISDGKSFSWDDLSLSRHSPVHRPWKDKKVTKDDMFDRLFDNVDTEKMSRPPAQLPASDLSSSGHTTSHHQQSDSSYGLFRSFTQPAAKQRKKSNKKEKEPAAQQKGTETLFLSALDHLSLSSTLNVDLKLGGKSPPKLTSPPAALHQSHTGHGAAVSQPDEEIMAPLSPDDQAKVVLATDKSSSPDLSRVNTPGSILSGLPQSAEERLKVKTLSCMTSTPILKSTSSIRDFVSDSPAALLDDSVFSSMPIRSVPNRTSSVASLASGKGSSAVSSSSQPDISPRAKLASEINDILTAVMAETPRTKSAAGIAVTATAAKRTTQRRKPQPTAKEIAGVSSHPEGFRAQLESEDIFGPTPPPSKVNLSRRAAKGGPCFSLMQHIGWRMSMRTIPIPSTNSLSSEESEEPDQRGAAGSDSGPTKSPALLSLPKISCSRLMDSPANLLAPSPPATTSKRVSVRSRDCVGLSRLSVRSADCLGVSRVSVQSADCLGVSRVSVQSADCLGVSRVSVQSRDCVSRGGSSIPADSRHRRRSCTDIFSSDEYDDSRLNNIEVYDEEDEMSVNLACPCGLNDLEDENPKLLIFCNFCNYCFHTDCVGLGPDDIAVVEKSDLDWFCPGCLEKGFRYFSELSPTQKQAITDDSSTRQQLHQLGVISGNSVAQSVEDRNRDMTDPKVVDNSELLFVNSLPPSTDRDEEEPDGEGGNSLVVKRGKNWRRSLHQSLNYSSANTGARLSLAGNRDVSGFLVPPVPLTGKSDPTKIRRSKRASISTATRQSIRHSVIGDVLLEEDEEETDEKMKSASPTLRLGTSDDLKPFAESENTVRKSNRLSSGQPPSASTRTTSVRHSNMLAVVPPIAEENEEFSDEELVSMDRVTGPAITIDRSSSFSKQKLSFSHSPCQQLSISWKSRQPKRSSFYIVPSTVAGGARGRSSALAVQSETSASVSLPSSQVAECDVDASVLLEPDLSDLDKLLRRCEKGRVVQFEEEYPEEVLAASRKVGEGAFGEVYLLGATNGEKPPVLKVVPIGGDIKVNDEEQTGVKEMLSEVVISCTLSNLRSGTNNQTDGFVEVRNCVLFQGEYPPHLLSLWDKFDEENTSENYRPDYLPRDQLYMALEFNNGGRDLEKYEFKNATQALAAWTQVVHTVGVAEQACQFEHRDLHWGNILIRETEAKRVVYRLAGETYEVETHGVETTIIDFSLSRLTSQEDNCTIFNNLAQDPTLFTAGGVDKGGDYQFDIYRMMKAGNRNSWEEFRPKSNIYWLHYVLDKMCTEVYYKAKKNSKPHKSGLASLRSLKSRLLEDFTSASEWVSSQGNRIQS